MLGLLCGLTALAPALPQSSILLGDCLAHNLGVGWNGCLIADFDGDSLADSATIRAPLGEAGASWVVVVRLGREDLARELRLPGGRAAIALTLRDVNGDGFRDIALIGVLNQTVGVFLNDGHGCFHFDALDRYLTAPSDDFSVLSPPDPVRETLYPDTAPASKSIAALASSSAEHLPGTPLAAPTERCASRTVLLGLPRSRAP